MNFSIREYEKILYFINSTYSSTSSIVSSVQKHLSKLFHLDTSLFWLSDREGNMYNLNFYNFEDKVIWDYTETYKNKDVMHPKKLLNSSAVQLKNVLTINETTTTTSLAKSEYYHFVKKHKIIDQMVIYFTDEKVIYGGIGFPRFEGEKPFSQKDKEILRALANHLRNLVKNSLIKNELEAKNLIFKNRTEPGIIQFLTDLKVTYYNETAQKLINRTSRYSSVEEFIHKTISSYLPINSTINIYLDDFKLLVTPYKQNQNATTSFNVYLYPQENNEDYRALLSKREIEIFDYVLKGYTNKQISEELCISINTVKKHLRNMYEKLEVSNRASLIYKLTKNDNLIKTK